MKITLGFHSGQKAPPAGALPGLHFMARGRTIVGINVMPAPNLILINPAGNNGRALQALEKAARESPREIRSLFQASERIILKPGQRPSDPAILDRLRSRRRVFICSGDGTINWLVTALLENRLETRVRVGIIPGGFGNAAAAMLGIRSTREGLALLSPDTPSLKTDVLKTNLSECPYVVFAAGIGLEGKIVHTRQLAKWLSALGYVLAAIWELFAHRRGRFILKIDGGTKLSVLASSIMIANGPYFGFLTSAPKALINDGRMDVRLFHENLNFLLNLQPQNMSLYPVDDFSYIDIRAKTLQVRGRLTLQIDGDPVKSTDLLELQVLPKRIQYLIPRKHSDHP